MAEITEIFILKMKESEELDAIREAAREDFTSLDGVTSWETYITTAEDRPTLYAEVYTFPDYETAKKVTPQFAHRDATKAFLGCIDEMIVGQYFKQYVPKT